MTGLVILILSAMVLYLNIMLRRANNTIDEIQAGRQLRSGEIRVTVSPGQFQKFLAQINQSGHQPTSRGGITPQLCLCGKPLEDHR